MSKKSNGWIKIYRKLRENPIYTNSRAVHVWLECLLRARHEKKTVYLKREKIELRPGSFVMGRDEFGESIGMSGSTAWYWINEFKADNMLDINTTSKGTVVTVKNWKEYQKVDNSSNNKKTAEKQQKNTNKNDKNVKNVKKLCIDVLEHWNEKEIIQHQLKGKIGRKIGRSINGVIRQGGDKESIMQAIDTYSEILEDDRYYFNHSWTLDEFLDRGFEKFKNREVARRNYLKDGEEMPVKRSFRVFEKGGNHYLKDYKSGKVEQISKEQFIKFGGKK